MKDAFSSTPEGGCCDMAMAIQLVGDYIEENASFIEKPTSYKERITFSI